MLESLFDGFVMDYVDLGSVSITPNGPLLIVDLNIFGGYINHFIIGYSHDVNVNLHKSVVDIENINDPVIYNNLFLKRDSSIIHTGK